MDKYLHNLLMRLQKKDGTALDELLMLAGRRLYSVAYCILNNREDAEDAFQDGMLRLVRGINRYRYQNPYSYIASIVRNASIDIYNKKRNSTVNIASIPDIAVEDFADSSLNSHAVTKAIAALTPSDRKLIFLYYFNCLTIREISTLMEMPKSTVQNRLRIAGEELAKMLVEG